MKRSAVAAVAFTLTCALAVPAFGEHGSIPAWSPIVGLSGPAILGTGGVMCLGPEVHARLDALTVDISRSMTSGNVAAQGMSVCTGSVPVRVTMTTSVYQQQGLGPADPSTIGEVEPVHLALLGTNTCTFTATQITLAGCETGAVHFENGPGTRLVVTNGTTYEIKDPRGAAWIVMNPLSCRESAESRAKAYCFVAADFRS